MFTLSVKDAKSLLNNISLDDFGNDAEEFLADYSKAILKAVKKDNKAKQIQYLDDLAFKLECSSDEMVCIKYMSKDDYDNTPRDEWICPDGDDCPLEQIKEKNAATVEELLAYSSKIKKSINTNEQEELQQRREIAQDAFEELLAHICRIKVGQGLMPSFYAYGVTNLYKNQADDLFARLNLVSPIIKVHDGEYEDESIFQIVDHGLREIVEEMDFSKRTFTV